jgi:hypothetical protein
MQQPNVQKCENSGSIIRGKHPVSIETSWDLDWISTTSRKTLWMKTNLAAPWKWKYYQQYLKFVKEQISIQREITNFWDNHWKVTLEKRTRGQKFYGISFQ